MGVYINGFPLPNNCGACPLRLAWCRERIYMVNRPDRCPLVPVPPHGRLIDADACLALINDSTILSDFLKCIINPLIRGEPTVIEAEEGET